MSAPVKILERQAVQLFVHVFAHIEHDFLRDVRHHDLLHVPEKRADQVQRDDKKEYPVDIRKIERRHRLIHHHGGILRHKAVKELCRHLSLELWTDDTENGTEHRENQHDAKLDSPRPEVRKKTLENLSHVLWFFDSTEHHSAGAARTCTSRPGATHSGSARAFALMVAHAISSSESCEATISRYTGQSAYNSLWVPIPAILPSSRTIMRSAFMIVATR